ncbi:MAG: hypothetical protein OSA84_04430 [Akkermansiaceae bacterium]|nr:hypothetical protein [Akkermansiaceae bacterium]
MKRQNDNPFRQIAALMSGASALLLSLALASQVHAQSADIFTQGQAESAVGSSKEQKEPEPVDERPSRFAGADIESYTESRAAVFSMRNRKTDPFGLNQDPSVKPGVKKIASKLPVKRQLALPPTPLGDIVKLIRVTTIMPGEKKFLVGVRSFSEVDEFPLIFRGKRMNMKVVEVSSRRILFQNLDNGDKASLETEMLPPGMMAGGDNMQPPGLVSPLDNVPLELGSDKSLDANN